MCWLPQDLKYICIKDAWNKIIPQFYQNLFFRFIMIRILFISLIYVFSISCTNAKRANNYITPETALEAARQFIETVNKGKFDDANLMISTAANNDAIINKLKGAYNTLSNGQKQDLQAASINIHGIEEISQNETIINYSNSFDKKVHKLKVINQNGKWLVDIAYTFNGNL